MKCKHNENCHNGWINTASGYKVCECLRDQTVDKFYNWSNAPLKYKKRLSELEDQKIKNGKGTVVNYKRSIEQLTGERANIDYMVKNDFRIVLKGGTGSGKTQYAITLAMEILANYDLQNPQPDLNKFYFLSVHELKEIIFNDEKKKQANYYDKINKSQVLILDDIGTELQIANNKLPYILDELDALIRNFQGVLILTTNMADNLKEIYLQYNQRLASVILTDVESNHGVHNSLFYNITLANERRKKKNTGATFL